MNENDVKESILDRLYKRVGICSHCGNSKCPHDGHQHLPNEISADDVLRAINLDNYFDSNVVQIDSALTGQDLEEVK